MEQQSVVPSFFLFGEPVRTVEGRFVHLEDLDDRSRPNDWNIRPHAHADLNHVFHIVTGGGVMRDEAAETMFTAPCLLLVPAGVVHGFAWQAETTGSVLTLANSYLRELVDREPDFAGLFELAQSIDLGASTVVARAIARLSRELNWSAPGGRAAVEAHLLAVLVEALRLSVRARSRGGAAPGASAALVARFRELVEAHYREALPIETYGVRLGVTVAQLRGACRKVATTSPLQLIQDRLMLEAKRALLYSNMTITEIAFHLGFQDPAYFTRFFSKSAGCSPRHYRSATPQAPIA
jgi:AraC family transcriptional activator of pobA